MQAVGGRIEAGVDRFHSRVQPILQGVVGGGLVNQATPLEFRKDVAHEILVCFDGGAWETALESFT